MFVREMSKIHVFPTSKFSIKSQPIYRLPVREGLWREFRAGSGRVPRRVPRKVPRRVQEFPLDIYKATNLNDCIHQKFTC